MSKPILIAADAQRPAGGAKVLRPPAFAALFPPGPAAGRRRRRRAPSRPLVLAAASALHVGLVWVVQAEFRHPPIEISEPEAIMAELVEMPGAAPAASKAPPTADDAPPKAPAKPSPAPPAAPRTPARAVAATDAPFVLAAAAAQPPGPPAAPTAAVHAASADEPPAPVVRPPSADADYASSCQVAYPPLSRAMREHGRVTLTVLVGQDGRSKRVQVLRSSGSPRLDLAAREAMQRCRFRPGTVNGVAQDMAYEAPVEFVLR